MVYGQGVGLAVMMHRKGVGPGVTVQGEGVNLDVTGCEVHAGFGVMVCGGSVDRGVIVSRRGLAAE